MLENCLTAVFHLSARYKKVEALSADDSLKHVLNAYARNQLSDGLVLCLAAVILLRGSANRASVSCCITKERCGTRRDSALLLHKVPFLVLFCGPP